MAEPSDPYRVLGVSRTASLREIRAAYRARARRSHPDLAGEDSIGRMRELNAAWELLKDAHRRDAHDAAARAAAEPQPRKPAGSSTRSPHDERRRREPWTGAAGPPPGQPMGTTMPSGIYAGWSLAQIARRDPGYLVWLRDRPEGRRHAAEIARLLQPERPR